MLNLQNLLSQDSFEAEIVSYLSEIQGGAITPFFEESVEYAERLAVHAKGATPDKILKISRPNEPEDVQEYRRNVYKPKTTSDWNRATSVLNSVLNSGLYSIKFPELSSNFGEGESPEDYFADNYPVHGSFTRWGKDILIPAVLGGPNCVLAFIDLIPAEMRDQTQFPQPFPCIYPSEDVVDFVENFYYTVIHKRYKIEGQEAVQYLTFTPTSIISAAQVSGGAEPRFEISILSNHGAGIVPARRLGGIIANSKPPYFYKSFLDPVLSYWDDVVRLSSDMEGVLANHLFPEKVVITDDCNAEGCFNGMCGEDVCGSCHGSGKVTPRGPFGEHRINMDKLGDENVIFPGVQYVQKDLEPYVKLREEIEYNRERGFDAIHMDTLNKTPLNESGTAKEIDRRQLQTFIKTFSDHIWHIVEWGFLVQYHWRYDTVLNDNIINANLPEITKPVSFIEPSVNELGEELAKPNLPNAFRAELSKEITRKKFGNNSKAAKFEEIKSLFDKMPFATVQEKSELEMSGAVSKRDLIASVQIHSILENLFQIDPVFLSRDIEEIKALVNAEIDKLVPQLGPTIPIQGGDPIGGGEADLDGADTATTSKILQTVGGITALANIQKEVGQGSIPVDKAVNTLKIVFGLTDSQAKSLLGRAEPIAE